MIGRQVVEAFFHEYRKVVNLPAQVPSSYNADEFYTLMLYHFAEKRDLSIDRKAMLYNEIISRMTNVNLYVSDSDEGHDAKTLLICAAYESKKDLVSALLSHPSVEVNKPHICPGDPRCNNATPLYYAATNGNLHVATLLLQKNASPFIANSAGQTPLMAVTSNSGMDEVVRQGIVYLLQTQQSSVATHGVFAPNQNQPAQDSMAPNVARSAPGN